MGSGRIGSISQFTTLPLKMAPVVKKIIGVVNLVSSLEILCSGW